MHKSKQFSVIVWDDKKYVFVMSTVTPPIYRADEECLVVERRVRHLRKVVETSHTHFQYIKFMRGVNIADQLRNEYSW